MDEQEETPVSVTIEKVKQVQAQGGFVNVDRLYKVTLRGPGQGEEVSLETGIQKALARASGWLTKWAHPGELKQP